MTRPRFDVPLDPEFLVAAGGWCAPSDQVYSVFDVNRPLPVSACGGYWPLFDDECEGFEHSCLHEYNGPHEMCVCEYCGKTRVVLMVAGTDVERSTV